MATEDKIRYKNLSGWLKFAVISGWIIGFAWILMLTFGILRVLFG